MFWTNCSNHSFGKFLSPCRFTGVVVATIFLCFISLKSANAQGSWKVSYSGTGNYNVTGYDVDGNFVPITLTINKADGYKPFSFNSIQTPGMALADLVSTISVNVQLHWIDGNGTETETNRPSFVWLRTDANAEVFGGGKLITSNANNGIGNSSVDFIDYINNINNTFSRGTKYTRVSVPASGPVNAITIQMSAKGEYNAIAWYYLPFIIYANYDLISVPYLNVQISSDIDATWFKNSSNIQEQHVRTADGIMSGDTTISCDFVHGRGYIASTSFVAQQWMANIPWYTWTTPAGSSVTLTGAEAHADRVAATAIYGWDSSQFPQTITINTQVEDCNNTTIPTQNTSYQMTYHLPVENPILFQHQPDSWQCPSVRVLGQGLIIKGSTMNIEWTEYGSFWAEGLASYLDATTVSPYWMWNALAKVANISINSINPIYKNQGVSFNDCWEDRYSTFPDDPLETHNGRLEQIGANYYMVPKIVNTYKNDIWDAEIYNGGGFVGFDKFRTKVLISAEMAGDYHKFNPDGGGFPRP